MSRGIVNIQKSLRKESREPKKKYVAFVFTYSSVLNKITAHTQYERRCYTRFDKMRKFMVFATVFSPLW